MTNIQVKNNGEIRITANGQTIAEFWLPESDRLDMVVKLLKSIKENPANKGGGELDSLNMEP